MDTLLISAGLALGLINLVLMIVLLKRSRSDDAQAVTARLDELDKSQLRVHELVQKEITQNRGEALASSQLLRKEISENLEAARAQNAAAAQSQRQELSASIKELGDSLVKTLGEMAASQKAAGDTHVKSQGEIAKAQQQQFDSFAQRLATFASSSEQKLDATKLQIAESAKTQRDELAAVIRAFGESVNAQLAKLTQSSELKLDALRTAVEHKLTQIQTDNAAKLEEMRKTVDEKLQGTLDKRLGESFKQVSDRLEQVHKGLGEMQTLATGVGDLKKVLTNVKTRGTWGEYALGNLIEQVLTPDQYLQNVATKTNSTERVEFCVRMPGRGEGNEDLLLPIDAKFPREDYERLVEAAERADVAGVEESSKALEARVLSFAQDVSTKYINVPRTTDFAILFLPTEGLFAEVLRRPGLVTMVQEKYRVSIAGPTTLLALLNSLQMGFRTLAIQKRSSEVWQVLGAVKTEFSKFGGVLEKVEKKLQEASNVVSDAQKRSRAVDRKLRGVEATTTTIESQGILGLPESAADNEDA